MASIEKLVKSLEALKVIQTPVDKPEEAFASTRFINRKETSLTKKDKLGHCVNISEIICNPQLRTIEDFHKFLGISIETLLHYCDDAEADVRINASECLNRTIRSLADQQLGRIQVELYKEIKKNGRARSLRAGLSRFADLCHLIKPSKRRPYLVNLIPCLIKISQRTDEDDVQETLSSSLAKLMPVFAKFASDTEVSTLIKAFTPNVHSPNAAIRRTAAVCLGLVCSNSKKPTFFATWLLNALLTNVSELRKGREASFSTSEDQHTKSLIGLFVTARQLIPIFKNIPSADAADLAAASASVYVHVPTKQRELAAREEAAAFDALTHLYELIVVSLRSETDHTVTLAALEALQQLLKSPPAGFLAIINDEAGITKSRLGDDVRCPSVLASPMVSNKRIKVGSVASSTDNMAALEYDDEVIIRTNIRTLHGGDIKEESTSMSQEPMVTREGQSVEQNNSFDEADSEAALDRNHKFVSVLEHSKSSDSVLNESEPATTKFERLKPSNKSLNLMKLTYLESAEDTLTPDGTMSPSNAGSTNANEGDSSNFKVGSIGDFMTPGIASIEFCARLVSGHFLLTGVPGGLMPDKNVRVSLKSLALNCISLMVTLHSKVLLIDLHLDIESLDVHPPDGQRIWDVLLFSGHHDPHIRGQVATITASFLAKVLTYTSGYTNFLLANCTVGSFGEAPSIDDLLTGHLLKVTFDPENSSVAIRSGLVALSSCIVQLIKSDEGLGKLLIENLRKMLAFKDHNYWLLKVELLNLLSLLPLKDIYHLEKALVEGAASGETTFQRPLQELIISDVVPTLLADDDQRVRAAASSCLVKIVVRMFIPSDYPDGDPVTALAVEQSSQNLPQFAPAGVAPTIAATTTGDSPFPTRLLSKTFGFVVPFASEGEAVTSTAQSENIPCGHFFAERNLSHIVKRLEGQLFKNLSNRRLLSGIILALNTLASEYPVTSFPKAWAIEAQSNSSTITFVRFLLSLITSSTAAIAVDLSWHQRVLNLCGDLVSGMAYSSLKSSVECGATLSDTVDSDFGLLSRDAKPLVMVVEQLMGHIIKLLRLLTCILENSSLPAMFQATGESKSSQNSTQSSVKPVMQSLSNATLSPIRRKTSLSRGSVGGSDKLDSSKTRNLSGSPGSCDVIYSRVFEVLRASYSNYKTTVDSSVPSRFVTFAETTLKVLSQLLELTTLVYISPRTEEILDSLKVLMFVCPVDATVCVRQLLKAIFGTNFIMLMTPEPMAEETNDDQGSEGTNSRPSSINRVHRGMSISGCLRPHYGLYQTCVSNPYTQLSQFYGSRSFGSGQDGSSRGSKSRIEENARWLVILRKTVERRVTGLLDKGTTGTTTGPSVALSSHIRFFEPVVIKALKLYTVTANVRLQVTVLELLSQLVKLRVNYCLLDSDQVFLGFLLKQFELFESGHADASPQPLVGAIFEFLVLLSYERVDTRPIVSVPKIIQLGDGLLASGQDPEKFALPALVPLVEDLYCLRSPVKSGESAKELDAQREVLTAALLKVACFPSALELLSLVVSTAARESEEKHKKVSRMVIDSVTPLVARQAVRLDSWAAVESLHELFGAVSGTVFRPVDFLLKAIFSPPREDLPASQIAFRRWMAGVLVLTRSLTLTSKEDTILARLDELRPTSLGRGSHGLAVLEPAFRIASGSNSNDDWTESLSSEAMLAEFLLQTAQLAVTSLIRSREASDVTGSRFDAQMLGHYILYMTHMFQSGSFRRVAKAASAILKDTSGPVDVNFLNASFKELEAFEPTLLVQWANVLILLGYDDFGSHEFWYEMVKPSELSLGDNSNASSDSSQTKAKSTLTSSSTELVRRGTLVLLCDFVAENVLADAEQMAWLLSQNVELVVNRSYELPVKEFISAVHRKPASSGLFLQAVSSRCEKALTRPAFVRRLLTCLEYVHPTQSGALVSLLVERLIAVDTVVAAVTLRASAEDLVLARVEMILKSESVQEMSGQLSQEDVDKLLERLKRLKHCRIRQCLEELRLAVSEDPESTLDTTGPSAEVTAASRDWFVALTKSYCSHGRHAGEVASLLNKLPHEEMNDLLSDPRLLSTCLEAGYHMTTMDIGRHSNGPFAAASSGVLFKAALKAACGHVERLASMVPHPHFGYLPKGEASAPKEAKHRDKLTGHFEDVNFMSFMTKSVDSFVALVKFGLKSKLAEDTKKAILRVAVLFAEAAQWASERGLVEHFPALLKVLKVFGKSEQLIGQLAVEDNVTLVYSIVAGAHSMFLFVNGQMPHVIEPMAFVENKLTQPDWKHAHKTCIRATELLQLFEIDDKNRIASCSRLMESLRPLVLAFCRLSLVNSFVIVPPTIWKVGSWRPNFVGAFGTVCPTPPAEDLRDMELLETFEYRIKLIGWTSRIQFEEFWMSVLGVMSIVQSEEGSSTDEQIERTQLAMSAVRGITDLLLQTLHLPKAGNPLTGRRTKLVHSRPAAFLHTKYGERFQAAKKALGHCDQFQDPSDLNRISVEYLRKAIGAESPSPSVAASSPSLSSGSESATSSSTQSPATPKDIEAFPLTDQLPHRASLEIDLKSSVRFILDLYGQVTSTSNAATPLLTEIVRSLTLISDLFFERQHFEWMLDLMLDMYRSAVSSEDEIQIQHLVFGVSKCSAVLGVESEAAVDKLRKCIDNGLKSTFLGTRICTLRGIMYVLEQRDTIPGEKQAVLLPIVSDYLLKHLSEPSLPSSKNKDHVTVMWTLAFQLIEKFVDDFTESEFSQKLFQIAMKIVSSDDQPAVVKEIVTNGLERLLILEVFAIKDADIMVRTALEKFRSGSLDELPSFRLVLAAMYVFGLAIGNESAIDEAGSSEELLAAMEKLSAMFDRLKNCSSTEAEAVCRALPLVLCDFFPTQDILNKMIGELLSAQQLFPQHLAHVVFKVFGVLISQSRADDVQDWVLLSLSSFTQLEPLSLAVWSLTTLLIAACSSEWVRAIFPCIRERLGKLEATDKRVLSVVSGAFYAELKLDTHREQFLSTILTVSRPGNPYEEVISQLRLTSVSN